MGRSTAMVLLAQVATAVLTLASSVLVARALGTTGVGTLTMLITICWIVSVLLDFGMSSTAAYGVGRLDVHPAAVMGLFGVLSLGILALAAIIAASPLSALIADTFKLGGWIVVAAGILSGACLSSINLVRQLLMTAGHDSVTAVLWPLDRLVPDVVLSILFARGAGIDALPPVFAASIISASSRIGLAHASSSVLPNGSIGLT